MKYPIYRELLGGVVFVWKSEDKVAAVDTLRMIHYGWVKGILKPSDRPNAVPWRPDIKRDILGIKHRCADSPQSLDGKWLTKRLYI